MLHTTPPDPAALARRPDTPGPLAVATPTTRKLADASISLNTRRAYLGALARLDAWRGTATVDDALLAAYLAHVFESGRAPATAALAVAAVRFRAKLAGQPDPAGAATARVLGGYRRTGSDRGRGQAAPLSADGLAAILATAERPRTDGRGVESHTTAQRRGRTDAVIAGLLFMGGLRRSEVSALEWRDVSDASDGDGVLLTVRTSKTNQEGDTADVRYLKTGAAKAIRTVRADRPDAAPTDRVVGLGSLQIQRRFTAAAHAAGIEARLTAHSGRVGLASELTARGASTTEVMLAGNWKTSRMVAHYSAGATAERGPSPSICRSWFTSSEASRMTDTQRPWDRRADESDPAFEAFALYLETGSLRDAYRQRSGKAQATAAPGAWTGWSTKYNWVSRRAAYVEFTVRECQDATQVGLQPHLCRALEACLLVLKLIVASRDEDDSRRRQVKDVGREVLRNVAGFFSRPMTTFPVSDGWDTTFQHGPQTSELAL